MIYIPAHNDFKSAIEQAQRCREGMDYNFKDSNVEVKITIVISVNGTLLAENDFKALQLASDRLHFISENIGADTNISLGFLEALREQSDYLWILSTNDALFEGAINCILEAIENSNSDLIVIGKNSSTLTGKLTSAFRGDAKLLPIGLISAVIYRTEKFKESFASALKFSWTGWGQLSAIQNALFEVDSLSYEVLEESSIYDRQSNLSYEDQLKKNQAFYRHSFFGYPLIVSILFNQKRSLRNLIIREWLILNWYKIGYFKDKNALTTDESSKNVYWTEQLSKRFILFSGLFSPFMYLVGNLSLIYNFRRYKLMQKLRSYLTQKSGS